MVECGALDDWLQLANAPVGENCLQGDEADFGVEDTEKLSITSSIDQVDDFYEAAVSVLMEQAVEHTKRGPYGRVDGTDICDFCGCLYSLHASRGIRAILFGVNINSIEYTVTQIHVPLLLSQMEWAW